MCCSFGKQCGVCCIGHILVLIGALNWGLVGLSYFVGMELNVVYLLLGNWPLTENIVYIVVGLAALGGAICSIRGCPWCAKMNNPTMGAPM